jgi:transcriptional regulator with XRE-family HTH domain
MKINERILKIQKELNLTQEEFSIKTGISIKSIRCWYYRDSIPRGDSLEKILRGIPQINIKYLMLEEDPPLLPNVYELPPQKKWSEKDDKIFRTEDYTQFVFLFENARSPKLNHDIYRVVDAEGMIEKIDKGLGSIFGSAFDALSKLLERTKIDIFTEFYAKYLYMIVNDIAARKPLDPTETYLLCSIGRITPTKLRAFDQTLCPPDELEEFKRKIDPNNTLLLRIHEAEKLSREEIQTVHTWKFVQQAYQQLAKSLRRDEFPNYCKIHERLHWTLECPECSKK